MVSFDLLITIKIGLTSTNFNEMRFGTFDKSLDQDLIEENFHHDGKNYNSA